MSLGPKKQFWDIFGILPAPWELRLASMHHRPENKHFGKNVCLFSSYLRTFFQQFEQFLHMIFQQHAVTSFCDTFGVFRKVLTYLNTLSFHFINKNRLPNWCISKLSKCTDHSWDDFLLKNYKSINDFELLANKRVWFTF